MDVDGGLLIPPEVERPCAIAMVQGGAIADLEVAYMRRGQQLVECDAARQLAVEIINKHKDLAKML